MAEDMNSALNVIKGLLGDNADEKIQSVVNSLSENTADNGISVDNAAQSADLTGDDNMQYILRMKGLLDEMSHTNDARSNLLLSLKPYMRESRKQGIDNALKLLSLTKVSALFKNMR